ncbi:PREDICTED: uncharacterized protein LOC108759566 [Trachymyrmex cornetzi]|nr:PREDICTED: uncharacterized protein LOC108759566 [Trachymyrmex cornetzi]
MRPISLLSCTLKLMEKIVYWRLLWLTEHKSLLPQEQMGFRPGRSCVESLTTFSNNIHASFIGGDVVVAVFLDITGAFDNIHPLAVLNELKAIGAPASIRKFVENLISCRTVHFIEDGVTSDKNFAYKGTPQGSALSPLLFSLALRKIDGCMSEGTEFLQYADDIVIYASATNPADAQRSLQLSLNKVEEFLRERGLELSPAKSKWMVFSHKKQKSRAVGIPLSISHQEIPKVEQARFLGVIMDCRMKGSSHFKSLIKKGRAIVQIISSLAAVWWGSHPQCLLSIYRAVFRGAIEYACQIFTWHRNSNLFLQLERLQYRAIRIAMGYRQSTPINVILCETKELPLKLRFDLLSANFVLKCMSKINLPVMHSLERLENAARTTSYKAYALNKSLSFRNFCFNKCELPELHRSLFLPAFERDYLSLIFRKKFGEVIIRVKGRSNQEITQEFLSKLPDLSAGALTFYTDGSRISEDGCAGAATFSPELGGCFKYKLTTSASVFTAEAWAILQTLVIALDAGSTRVIIFSDSRSVLEAISSARIISGNYIIHRIKQTLLKLESEGIDCQLYWIPAHKGIPGNEVADRAAKEACSSGPRGCFKTPFTDTQAEARANFKRRFNNFLDQKALCTGAQYAELFPIKPTPWYHKLALNRREIVLVNRLRSNHYNLNYSLHRKNIVDSPSCPCGDPRQDANHIIFYCPCTRDKFGPLCKHLKESLPSCSSDIFPILEQPSSKLCRLLSSFFKAIDISP